MPIYAGGLNGAPWSKCNEMRVDTLIKYITKFISIANKSKFALESPFIHSLEYNKEMKNVYIANYDYSKTGYDPVIYQNKMEEFILYMNNEMFFKNKKLKLDIQGNWTVGKIIFLEKK